MCLCIFVFLAILVSPWAPSHPPRPRAAPSLPRGFAPPPETPAIPEKYRYTDVANKWPARVGGAGGGGGRYLGIVHRATPLPPILLGLSPYDVRPGGFLYL